MLSEKLLRPQVPQPIDSENGRPLSKRPPVAMQCAWFDDHARDTAVRAPGAPPARRRACGWTPNAPCPGSRKCAGQLEGLVEIPRLVDREHRARASRPRTDEPGTGARSSTMRKLPVPGDCAARRAVRCAGGLRGRGRQPAFRRGTSPPASRSLLLRRPAARHRASPAQPASHRRRRASTTARSPTNSWWRCRRSWSVRSWPRVGEIRARVDDQHHVARADADRRRAARIRRADVGLRAGGRDQVRLAHQLVRSDPWSPATAGAAPDRSGAPILANSACTNSSSLTQVDTPWARAR